MKLYRDTVTKLFEPAGSFFTGLREFLSEDTSGRENDYTRVSSYLRTHPLTECKDIAATYYFGKTRGVGAEYIMIQNNEPGIRLKGEGWKDETKEQTICFYLVFDVTGKCVAGADLILEDHKQCGYVRARDNGENNFFASAINHYIFMYRQNWQIEIVDASYIYSVKPPKRAVTIEENIPMNQLKKDYPTHFAAFNDIRKFLQYGNDTFIVWRGIINDNMHVVTRLTINGKVTSYTLLNSDKNIMSSVVIDENKVLTVYDIQNRERFYLTELFFDQIKKDAQKMGFTRIDIVLSFDRAAVIHKFKYKFSRRYDAEWKCLRFGIAV